MTCACGARIDGDSGYYRCHDRCGIRSIKKETLERAVLDEIFDQIFTEDFMTALQDEIRDLLESALPNQDYLVTQLRKEVSEVDRQIKELATMLTEVRHRRPLIQRIDTLEDERQNLEIRLGDLEKAEKPAILSMSRTELDEFADRWRKDLNSGTMEKRKAVFRQLIETATFDGEELTIAPNLSTLTGTGVKVASPRDSDRWPLICRTVNLP